MNKLILTTLTILALVAGAQAQSPNTPDSESMISDAAKNETDSVFSAPRNDSAYKYLADIKKHQASLFLKAGLGFAASSDPVAWSFEAGVNLKQKGRISFAVDGFQRKAEFMGVVYDQNTHSWVNRKVRTMVDFVPVLLSYDYPLAMIKSQHPQPSLVYLNCGLGPAFANRGENGFCARIGCSVYYKVLEGLGIEATGNSYFFTNSSNLFLIPAVSIGIAWQ